MMGPPFLQHMLSKWKPVRKWLAHGHHFTARRYSPAGAGSGESEIRRWVIENDWLEAVIGLPDQLFYNTGISTYILVLTTARV